MESKKEGEERIRCLTAFCKDMKNVEESFSAKLDTFQDIALSISQLPIQRYRGKLLTLSAMEQAHSFVSASCNTYSIASGGRASPENTQILKIKGLTSYRKILGLVINISLSEVGNSRDYYSFYKKFVCATLKRI